MTQHGLEVSADREACIGAAMCVAAAPAVFDLAADGKVEVLDSRPNVTELDAVEEAVELCPVRALALHKGR